MPTLARKKTRACEIVEDPSHRVASLRGVSGSGGHGNDLGAGGGGGSASALGGANVVLAGTPFHAITDTAGTFRFSGMAAGLYRIFVSHVGYASSDRVIETGPDGAQDLLFSLAPAPGRLDPVVVTASRAPATLLRSPVTAHVLDVGSGPSGAQTASDLMRALPGNRPLRRRRPRAGGRPEPARRRAGPDPRPARRGAPQQWREPLRRWAGSTSARSRWTASTASR